MFHVKHSVPKIIGPREIRKLRRINVDPLERRNTPVFNTYFTFAQNLSLPSHSNSNYAALISRFSKN